MSEETKSEVVEEQPVPEAPQEDGPAADVVEEELWEQEAAKFDEEAEPEPVEKKESVSSETPSEKKDDPEEKEEKPDPLRDLSARYEALENELRMLRQERQEAKKPESKPEEEKETLSDEEQILLESAPGLDKIIDRRAKKIAQALLHEIEQERAAKTSKEEVVVQEKEFWGELQEWAKSKNPDLDLDRIRQTPDFNDWLDSHKSWADAQMAKAKGRRDTSGAKVVFERFFKESQLEASSKAPGSKKLASARTPSSSTLRSAPRAAEESGDLWDRSVDELVAKESKRRYL